MKNFAFLSASWPLLSQIGELAEGNLLKDSNTTLFKLRMLIETITKYIYAHENLSEPQNNKQITRLNDLKNRGIIPDKLLSLFHTVRKSGNKATHEAFDSYQSAETCLKFSWQISVWFAKTYSDKDIEITNFELPQKDHDDPNILSKRSKDLEDKLTTLQVELDKLKSQEISNDVKAQRKKRSQRATKTINLSEVETRQLIDLQLNQAGWEADTQNLRYAKGARPEKNKKKAIAEWPTASGPADYALFIGNKLIGIVEAKKTSKDVAASLNQAERYSKDIEIKEDECFAGKPWGQYKIPFMFSTNGRPYLKQLELKSGIWFLDGRKSKNHPRALQAWYSPKGLEDLLSQDADVSEQKLGKEPFDYLGLRDFQIQAIQAVEKGLSEGKRELLLAMATGTGKTRTAIGLIYRLIKYDRFKRVLFLVDRKALGEQAEDAFKETRLEDLLTFNSIFDLKGIKEAAPGETTKVHISTVQGGIRRILFNENDNAIPSIDLYDCIVVDEAHRGYTLDKELGEVEIIYRDEKDFISKYRKVLEYFDAVKIGLTATPAPHTADIFGKPIFTYAYREAVIDGWLIDHEPPHQIKTKLLKDGIKWKKGETVPVYDHATGLITNIEDIPDDIELDVESFNKTVITKPFNQTVIKEFVKELDPESDEKTLIFAVTDDHADMVVEVLFEAFKNLGVDVDHDAIKKITGSIDKPLEMIKKYKNEKYPNIAVTVDLLTTGVDVPQICNLVFIRRVKSRILYEQMMGRATRLCDKIGKTHFNIFDTVGLYKVLKTVSNMKPVVPNPTITLKRLLDELNAMEANDEQSKVQQMQMEQIIAKLRRKVRSLDQEARDNFKTLTKGQEIEDFIASLKNNDLETAKTIIKGSQSILQFLDENKKQPSKQLISNHKDQLLSHTRGYGDGEKPEDFLNEFKTFIFDNMNKIPALKIVCTKPRELTRQSLKELRLALDQNGFTEPGLQVAWREWKNEDIAADIVSFIRKLALGDPLENHDDRIRNAMKKIYAIQKWNKIQRSWLERFELQLIKETILDKQDLETGAFKQNGGFKKINTIFQGNLEPLLEEIKKNIYPNEKKYTG